MKFTLVIKRLPSHHCAHHNSTRVSLRLSSVVFVVCEFVVLLCVISASVRLPAPPFPHPAPSPYQALAGLLRSFALCVSWMSFLDVLSLRYRLPVSPPTLSRSVVLYRRA